MTDQETVVSTGGDAQPASAENYTVESIFKQAAKNEPSKQEDNQQPHEEQETEQQTQEVDTPFPKKAVNAISRRDKTIGKQRAELEAMRAEIARLAGQAQGNNQREPQQQPQQPRPQQVNNDGRPQEKDYTTYAEYLEAVNDWKIEQRLNQRLSEFTNKQKQEQQTAQDNAWRQERLTAVDQQAAEFAKEYPEIGQLWEEYGDVIQEYPDELKNIFLAADNAPLAFLNLAKAGKIEAIASMSPAQAAMEIGRAQAQPPTKPKTKAPTPLPASRGSVPTGKPLKDLTPREAWKLFNPKD